VMIGTFIAVVAVLVLGRWWWASAAAAKSNVMIYQPPKLQVSLSPDGKMTLDMGESAWHIRRPDTVMTALIPDHGHLMHLFLIRTPQMDQFYHLHPDEAGSEVFTDDLPPIVHGHYKIFADIVRASGFPDTMVADADIPNTPGKPMTGDDSETSAPILGEDGKDTPASELPNGDRMVWERGSTPLASNRLLWFHFRVEDAAGKPATDLEPYMGMAAHAVFVASDFTVFAHVHPDGSIPMAALTLADASLPTTQDSSSSSMPGISMSGMPGMDTPAAKLPADVSFPYGFPKAGAYRIFVQVKRHGLIETGVFDAHVN
jgi:hypothetical protein